MSIRLEPDAFRKTHNLILGYASEALSPALRVVAGLAAPGPLKAPHEWRSALIIGHNHLGDVLYRTCSLEQLAAGLPGCRFSYLTARSSAELLKNNPALHELLPWNEGDDSWSLSEKARSELRARKFDAVLCTNTLRYYPDFALAVALGIPNRAGYTHKGLSGLVTHAVPLHFPSPYPAYFRGMVAHLTGAAPDWPLRPRIYPDDADRSAADAAWRALGRSESVTVACSITTRQRKGAWPSEHLVESLALARRERTFRIVLIGAAEDAQTLADAARELGDETHTIAGGVNVRALCELLRRCCALLTLDSGPRHIGNAAGIPVVFLRNLWPSRIETGAYCDTELDLAPGDEYLDEAAAQRVYRRISPATISRSLLNVISRSQRRLLQHREAGSANPL